MTTLRLTLDGPVDFSFKRTVFSHGWSDLAPFHVAADGRRIECALTLDSGTAIDLRLEHADSRRVRVQAIGCRTASDRSAVRQRATRILQLDLDLAPFRKVMRTKEAWPWMVRGGWGRLMRAPSVFEDLIKLILTTNCSWAFTRKMAQALVDRVGSTTPAGQRSFPTAEQVAALSPSFLREEIRAGYRAPYLLQLAEDVASGRIDPAGWAEDPRSTEELRKSLLELPGVGPYVADNILRLVGRPSGLGLDSFLRGKYARVFHGGRPVKDRTIEQRYRGCGKWGALVLWCEMTRD